MISGALHLDLQNLEEASTGLRIGITNSGRVHEGRSRWRETLMRRLDILWLLKEIAAFVAAWQGSPWSQENGLDHGLLNVNCTISL